MIHKYQHALISFSTNPVTGGETGKKTHSWTYICNPVLQFHVQEQVNERLQKPKHTDIVKMKQLQIGRRTDIDSDKINVFRRFK